MNDGAPANTPKAEDHVAIPKKYIIVAQTAGCLWLTAWAFFIFVASKDADSAWINRLALIGDSFGPLSALLTVAALFTTAVSTYVQIREFRNQIREMSESKQELGKQTEAMQSQLNEMRKQTANQILFQTINHLPTFHFYLRDLEDGQAILELSNYGAAVSHFELSADCTVISMMGGNLPMKGSLLLFGDSSCGTIMATLEWPVGDDSKELSLELDYVLYTGLPMKDSLKICPGHQLTSSRSYQIETLKQRLWIENGVGFP